LTNFTVQRIRFHSRTFYLFILFFSLPRCCSRHRTDNYSQWQQRWPLRDDQYQLPGGQCCYHPSQEGHAYFRELCLHTIRHTFQRKLCMPVFCSWKQNEESEGKSVNYTCFVQVKWQVFGGKIIACRHVNKKSSLLNSLFSW